MIRSHQHQKEHIRIFSNEIADKYKAGEKMDELIKQYRLSLFTIHKILERRKIIRRKRGHHLKKYSFNESFFDIIDSEQKAYWLGFITADGGIVKSGYEKAYKALSISLSTEDVLHLEKFKKNIHSTHPIHDVKYKDKRKGSRIIIVSRKLVSALATHGVVPNKTGKTKASEFVPNKFARHYWRGIMDGDGSLYEYNQKQNGKINSYPRLQFIGDIDLVNSFKEYCLPFLTFVKSYPNYDRHSNIYKLTFGKKDSIEIIKNLYYNCNIYLDRKMKKAGYFLNKFPN